MDDHCVQSYSRNVTIITPIPITSQCVQFYSPLSPIPTAWDPIISDNQVVWSLAALEREPFGKIIWDLGGGESDFAMLEGNLTALSANL